MPDIFVAPQLQGQAKIKQKTVIDKLKKEKKEGDLKAFRVAPKRVSFETQEAKEKIVLLLRQHWITQVSWIVIGVGLVFMPLVLLWIPLIDFLPSNYQFMVKVMWYLLIIAYVFEKFITWFYHVFIITDERIIDIDFFNLLYKEVSEAKIDNIEDVTYKQGGVSRAFFNFGDVNIQTAGEKNEFLIERVPQPYRVVKVLNELKLEEEQEKIEGRVR